MKKPPTTPTVHILRAGRTLCNMPGLPKDWPKDHVWVGDAQAEEATCARCKSNKFYETRGENRGVR